MKATTKRRDVGMAGETSLSAIIQSLISFPFSDKTRIEKIRREKSVARRLFIVVKSENTLFSIDISHLQPGVMRIICRLEIADLRLAAK